VTTVRNFNCCDTREAVPGGSSDQSDVSEPIGRTVKVRQEVDQSLIHADGFDG
jgi:hypothetical protein